MRAQRDATKVRPSWARVGLARATTALGSTGVGVVAAGAAAFGVVAIGAIDLMAIAVKRGKIGRLFIDELEVGRLRVRESIAEEKRNVPPPFKNLEGHAARALRGWPGASTAPRRAGRGRPAREVLARPGVFHLFC